MRCTCPNSCGTDERGINITLLSDHWTNPPFTKVFISLA